MLIIRACLVKKESFTMNRFIFFAAMCCISLSVSTAHAVPALDLPWPCSTSYSITQGHNTGSHTGKGAWAWDVGIGVGGEVVAPADGVVRRIKNDSTRYGCSRDYANDGNYVILDFGDGTEALFLHLRAGSITVQPGQQVSRGQKVGEVGNSGWICGTHLHFQIQQTCSSYYCQSIQANFNMYGDPGYGQRLESKNCGTPMVCKVPAGGEYVVDDTSACFQKVTQWWWTEQGGHGGSWQYTYAINEPNADTQAWWRFEVERTDDYDIEVHIPPGAQSKQAKYIVHIGQQTHGPIQIDQTAQQGWVKLGRFQITADTKADVNLADNTGEPYSEANKRRIAFDAIRIKKATTQPPIEDMTPDMVVDMSQDMNTPTDMSNLPDMTSTPDATPDMVASQDMNTTVDMSDMSNGDMPVGDMFAPNKRKNRQVTSTGSCATTPQHPKPATLWLLAITGLLWWRRRRG